MQQSFDLLIGPLYTMLTSYACYNRCCLSISRPSFVERTLASLLLVLCTQIWNGHLMAGLLARAALLCSLLLQYSLFTPLCSSWASDDIYTAHPHKNVNLQTSHTRSHTHANIDTLLDVRAVKGNILCIYACIAFSTAATQALGERGRHLMHPILLQLVINSFYLQLYHT